MCTRNISQIKNQKLGAKKKGFKIPVTHMFPCLSFKQSQSHFNTNCTLNNKQLAIN